MPYLLIESGKEKIRGFSGSLSREEISEIGRIAPIEAIGIYLLKKEFDWRLSLDATTILKNQISKNTIEITDKQLEEWIRGFDLDIKYDDKCTIVIKHDNDLIGCGKSNNQKIFNYLPQERRIKSRLKID